VRQFAHNHVGRPSAVRWSPSRVRLPTTESRESETCLSGVGHESVPSDGHSHYSATALRGEPQSRHSDGTVPLWLDALGCRRHSRSQTAVPARSGEVFCDRAATATGVSPYSRDEQAVERRATPTPHCPRLPTCLCNPYVAIPNSRGELGRSWLGVGSELARSWPNSPPGPIVYSFYRGAQHTPPSHPPPPTPHTRLVS
jgi:hypothetical protein